MPLLDDAVLVLHARLLDTGRAIDRPALALAKELALSGVGPDDNAGTLLDHDPKWLWANARSLIHADPGLGGQPRLPCHAATRLDAAPATARPRRRRAGRGL